LTPGPSPPRGEGGRRQLGVERGRRMERQAVRVQDKGREKKRAGAARPAAGPPPTPAPTQSPRVSWRYLALAALASAGLLWLSYFPVAWGWLGWVALVPLLVLVRVPASGRAVKACAWLAGLAFFWPALSWMR